MVSMLVSIPSRCIASMLNKILKILKKTKYRKKYENNTNFWKGVVQVWDDATKKMLL